MRLRAPKAEGGISDVKILKGKHGKAFYKGLQVCASVWNCPVCAAKIAERRRQELRAALSAAIAQGMRVHFVTLTVPHGIGDDLSGLNDGLSRATKVLSQGKYSIKTQLRDLCPGGEVFGYIRAFEVTHGQNGFHPHYHLLVFTNKALDSELLQFAYARAWQRACRLAGLPEPSLEHGCTVQDGSHADKYASKWGLEDEMTKAHMKQTKRKGATPWGLLRAVLSEDDPDYPPERASILFKVYAAAFKGRRQLFWSVGLRALLGLDSELSDEVLVGLDEDEDAVELATLTIEQWRAILFLKQEAHILTVAESNPDLLHVVLDSVVARALALGVTGGPLGVSSPTPRAPRLKSVEYRNSYQKGRTHEETTNPVPASRKVRHGRKGSVADVHRDSGACEVARGQLGLLNLASYASVRE